MADSARFAFAAQLAVLRSCPEVITMLLKNGAFILLAAKVLVISRLLHTKLAKRSNPPPFLEILRNRLASLRRKLLVRIDRHFKNAKASQDGLVEAMCAFSLATSSSSIDVVRHFHHLRLEAINENMRQTSGQYSNMTLALRLFVKTLKDTQTVLPIQLAQALGKLKSQSLFRSQDLYSLVELNLDVHEWWIGDDIKIFTPYIRHDELKKADAERLLKQWARQAVSSFLRGLQTRIHDIQDPLQLVQLRRELLELWLSSNQSSVDIDTSETLDGLRGVFNNQAIHLIKMQASSLNDVSSSVRELNRTWRAGVTDSTASLWEASMTSMETNSGGKVFKESLTSRFTGMNEASSKILDRYLIWLRSVEAIEKAIGCLRKETWMMDLDDVEDEDDLLDNKQILLSEDDPRLLKEELSSALEKAFTELQSSLEDQSRGSDGHQATFLLRIWRGLRQHLPPCYENDRLGLDSIGDLGQIAATKALSEPLERCSKMMRKSMYTKNVAARPLWEGDPNLPVLPSPWAYKLLLDTVSSMADSGTDIWSPQITDILKHSLALRLADLFEKVSESASRVNGHVDGEADDRSIVEANEVLEPKNHEGTTDMNGTVDSSNEHDDDPIKTKSHTQVNGTATGNGTKKVLADRSGETEAKIQRLFDLSYIIQATTSKSADSEQNGLVGLQTGLAITIQLDARSVERIKKDAAEYWKRTSLIFYLLG